MVNKISKYGNISKINLYNYFKNFGLPTLEGFLHYILKTFFLRNFFCIMKEIDI